MQEGIKKILQQSSDLKARMVRESTDDIAKVISEVIECYKRNKKILVCGNGGSAADAQHFAAEFVNRFYIDRQPLPAIALTTDSSVLTSIGNDAGFDFVFEKQVRALGAIDDLLFVITTSDISLEKNGHSTNLANALTAGRDIGMKNIGLISKKSKLIKEYLDFELVVPHTETPRIQEAHITILHIICEIAEKELFKSK